MIWEYDGYIINTDKSMVSVDRVKGIKNFEEVANV